MYGARGGLGAGLGLSGVERLKYDSMALTYVHVHKCVQISLFPLQGRVLTENGALTISSLTLSDGGMYQCVAENKHGIIYASAELVVLGKFNYAEKSETFFTVFFYRVPINKLQTIVSKRVIDIIMNYYYRLMIRMKTSVVLIFSRLCLRFVSHPIFY